VIAVWEFEALLGDVRATLVNPAAVQRALA
jgi:hypothetical protein